MPPIHHLLADLGKLIRARRVAARLTQSRLAGRAGIGGKYLSEIERGTRDLPLSTLRAIVRDGLGLVLDIRFLDDGSRSRPRIDEPLPRAVADVARAIAALPVTERGLVLAAVRAALRLGQR
jgi:transcriptional regulator with XRE-family HTH domain